MSKKKALLQHRKEFFGLGKRVKERLMIRLQRLSFET